MFHNCHIMYNVLFRRIEGKILQTKTVLFMLSSIHFPLNSLFFSSSFSLSHFVSFHEIYPFCKLPDCVFKFAFVPNFTSEYSKISLEWSGHKSCISCVEIRHNKKVRSTTIFFLWNLPNNCFQNRKHSQ